MHDAWAGAQVQCKWCYVDTGPQPATAPQLERTARSPGRESRLAQAQARTSHCRSTPAPLLHSPGWPCTLSTQATCRGAEQALDMDMEHSSFGSSRWPTGRPSLPPAQRPGQQCSGEHTLHLPCAPPRSMCARAAPSAQSPTGTSRAGGTAGQPFADVLTCPPSPPVALLGRRQRTPAQPAAAASDSPGPGTAQPEGTG